MIRAATTYSFPSLVEVGHLYGKESSAAVVTPDQAAVAQAMTEGYEAGLVQGRAAAETAAKEAIEAARGEGLAHGRDEGLAQVRQVAQTLSEALALMDEERANLARECESFCVDLSLAIVARLVEADTVRADFVSRAIVAALKVLAPQPPSAILMNPADRLLARGALEGLPVHDDETLSPGRTRVETGRLLVEAGIEEAFAQIKSAILEVKPGGRVKPIAAKRRTESADVKPDAEFLQASPSRESIPAKQGAEAVQTRRADKPGKATTAGKVIQTRKLGKPVETKKSAKSAQGRPSSKPVQRKKR